jgi:Transposase DDE domain
MSRVQALYQWTDRVQQLFPDLKPHHARDLAYYSFGVVSTHTCSLTAVAAFLATLLSCSYHTIRQRLRELYQPSAVQRGCARSTFDHTMCFGPLIRWAASGQKNKRLLLALDPTCHSDRFRVLAVSVLYEGGGLPVAWVIQKADEKGSWNAIWKDLLGRLREALGKAWKVLVLTDRGLESSDLFRAIVALGWHPLMRVKASGKMKPTGWRTGYPMKDFAPAVGRRWAGEGLAYPTGEKLPCTLLACWEAGHDEPWLILTDLPPAAANPAWYAWRMWIEHGFKIIKSGCWQWHHTRMEDATRAARLWAVLAVATLWAVEMGGEGEALDRPRIPEEQPGVRQAKTSRSQSVRQESLEKVGIRLLLITLINGAELPRGRLIQQPDWPARDWQSDTLNEEMMN